MMRARRRTAGVGLLAAGALSPELPRTGVDPGILLLLGVALLMGGVLVLRYAAEAGTA